jgi:Flp pilus assembly protein TadD
MVPVVSVERTLLRVEADLANGDTAMARRRLTSLVGAFPERSDVREHLARVCRMQGDLV